ncbi:hypothetical protein G8B22_08500 [Ligilactobacillus agilis]|uniref:hypothetical protein n=1 Tax=Ligilactobacillus agilis TaxID=1601 RepID=UPI001F59916D|nr:hypothetical protein [Ligilactobacillus agilis]UNL43169.1 hypothetical protein G8B22_08500 [Ligilactobacillus agilis]UNL57835.1 hypothetical protein G8B19_03220 [Ligilactobacillus agilis]
MKEIKVIAIPDETRILINYGYEDDDEYSTSYAKEGQRVAVVANGVSISDPDTKDFLGEYTPIKKKLEITDVFANFSVIRNVSHKDTSFLATVSPMLRSTSTKVFDPIPVNPEQILNINEDTNMISVGDKVIFLKK